MNRSKLYVAAMLMAGLLGVSATASAGAEKYTLSLPIVGLNNPCTAKDDSIDGNLDIHIIAQSSNGVHFVHAHAKGSGIDGYGLKYNINVKKKFQIHDPLPAKVQIMARMISQTSVDNAELIIALHVNEQGNVTKAEFSGVQCKG